MGSKAPGSEPPGVVAICNWVCECVCVCVCGGGGGASLSLAIQTTFKSS